MKTIKLTKMQGCGNDFVIIDYPEYEKTGLKMSELAKKVCNRNFGVGADGMIIPKLNPENKEADISWYFYNSDGSTAQMCGNGMRCFAKYCIDNKLVDKKSFSVETLAGIIKPELLDNGLIKVNMGKPILENKKIPFWSENGEKKLTAIDREFEITPVSMGNPHCVIITDEDPMKLAQTYGPVIEKHEFFPEKTNTEFVRVKSRMEIDMRVFERGCGITLACGTGACASVVACVLNNLTENKVKVNLLGGPVFIEWQGSADDKEQDIFLIGSANYSFFADYIL
ncbi:TPA: diaminopimelate epimerase [Candidatus Gastranaerophilales bacterium HUM_2]|nr:MAG TPA: diaminopimelate epimerase [Candidatus Gastranaerophilales bacterium HUM_2]